MLKPFAIAFAYCSIAGPYAIPIAQALFPVEYVLPPQVCPPTNWPLTQESRAKYKPFDNWSETVRLYTTE